MCIGKMAVNDIFSPHYFYTIGLTIEAFHRNQEKPALYISHYTFTLTVVKTAVQLTRWSDSVIKMGVVCVDILRVLKHFKQELT